MVQHRWRPAILRFGFYSGESADILSQPHTKETLINVRFAQSAMHLLYTCFAGTGVLLSSDFAPRCVSHVLNANPLQLESAFTPQTLIEAVRTKKNLVSIAVGGLCEPGKH